MDLSKEEEGAEVGEKTQDLAVNGELELCHGRSRREQDPKRPIDDHGVRFAD